MLELRTSCQVKITYLSFMNIHIHYYEGYSIINLRLVGKNKCFVIASKRTLSSNKELLFLLYAYPHTFSPRSVNRSGCIICICPGDKLCKVLRSQPPSDMTVTVKTVGKGMWTVFPECLVTLHMVLLPFTWPSISQTRGCTCLKWCFSVDDCCKWYLVPLGYSWWILHNGCHNSPKFQSDMYLTCRLQSYICTFYR